MYTLRIIDQSQSGMEQRVNHLLGKSYKVTMKAPVRQKRNSKADTFAVFTDKPGINTVTAIPPTNHFNKKLLEYYGEQTLPTNTNGEIDSNIIGFIEAEQIFAIRSNEVVYIVGSEGQTIERIYGLYEKY